jgi:tripartite-type tricarboxylate transporter receptor subunit TctC
MHQLLFLLIFFQSLLGLAASGLMQTAAAQGGTAAVQSQAWPTRPLRLVVPFNAGLTDTFGRVFAQFLGERLGQTVIVENRAGGGGVGARSRPVGGGDHPPQSRHRDGLPQ